MASGVGKIKKVPQRKCIVCGDHSDKRLLFRIVKTKQGDIFLDLTSKANGRGAYLCFKPECFEKMYKNRLLDKTFKMDVSEEVYDTLRKELKANEE